MDLCKTDDLVISANDYVILPAMSPMACMHPSGVEPRNLPECILSNWYCTTRGTVTMSSLTGIAASTSVHARNTAAARNRRASIATYLPYTTTGASASSRTHLEEEYLCKSGPETVPTKGARPLRFPKSRNVVDVLQSGLPLFRMRSMELRLPEYYTLLYGLKHFGG